jgi:hypothetical protein
MNAHFRLWRRRGFFAVGTEHQGNIIHDCDISYFGMERKNV